MLYVIIDHMSMACPYKCNPKEPEDKWIPKTTSIALYVFISLKASKSDGCNIWIVDDQVILLEIFLTLHR